MNFDFSKFRVPTFADVATGRRNNLNLLRMAAAVTVLFSHAYALTGHAIDEPLAVVSGRRTDAATIGVTVFFAISGFLIAQSLARRPSLRVYAVARLLRIVPALMLAKVFCVFVVGWYVTSVAGVIYWTHADTWRFLLGSPYFGIGDRLPGVFEGNPLPFAINGSLWTIPVETWCYVAAAILATTSLLRHPLAFTLVASTLVVGCWTFPGEARSWLPGGGDGTVPALVFTFLFGAWLSVCRHRVPLSLMLAAAALAALVMQTDGRRFAVLYYPGIAYVALVLAYHPSLQWRAYLRAGDYSYGTYVFAFPLQQFIVWRYGVTQPLTLLAMTLAVTLPIAIASWHAVEKPALALKPRLSAWRPGFIYGLRRTTRS